MGRDLRVETELTARDRATRVIRAMGGSIRRDLGSALGHAGKRIRQLTRGAAAAAKRLGMLGAAGAAAAGVGLWHVVTSTAASADELAKASRRAGMTAQAYAELQHAAGLAGVRSGEFASSIKQFTRNLGDMQAGRGRLLTFLEKVAPRFAQTLASTRDTGAALEMFLERLARIPDASRRAALATAAFGGSGASMTLLVEQGMGALLKARGEFSKYAGVIDSKALTAAEGFVDAQARVGLAIKGVKLAISQHLFPVLAPMLEQLASWVAANRQLIGQRISEVVASIARWIRDTDWAGVWQTVKGIAESFGKAWEAVGGLKTVLLAVAGILAARVVVSIGKAVLGVRRLVGGMRAARVEAAAMGVAGGGGARGGGRGGALAMLGGATGAALLASEVGILPSLTDVHAGATTGQEAAIRANVLIERLSEKLGGLGEMARGLEAAGAPAAMLQELRRQMAETTSMIGAVRSAFQDRGEGGIQGAIDRVKGLEAQLAGERAGRVAELLQGLEGGTETQATVNLGVKVHVARDGSASVTPEPVATPAAPPKFRAKLGTATVRTGAAL